jgi:hypothetical protein
MIFWQSRGLNIENQTGHAPTLRPTTEKSKRKQKKRRENPAAVLEIVFAKKETTSSWLFS